MEHRNNKLMDIADSKLIEAANKFESCASIAYKDMQEAGFQIEAGDKMWVFWAAKILTNRGYSVKMGTYSVIVHLPKEALE